MPDQQDTLIEISNLRFSYNDLDVLKGLDLAVPRGKVIAILGASGCGSTAGVFLTRRGTPADHLRTPAKPSFASTQAGHVVR